MTNQQIEAMPALRESNYDSFVFIISDALCESLENGDVIADMKTIRADFYHALKDALDGFSAPEGTIEQITRTPQ
jgi:DUF917 family protein